MSSKMRFSSVLLVFCLTVPLYGQEVGPDQIAEKAYPSVAMILAGRTPAEPVSAVGTGLVVWQNGILLTPYHLIKDAYSVQVRFKSGEIFDQVQLLGVDPRRDVAAIRIAAASLPALPIAIAAQAKIGDDVRVISHPGGKPWSASQGRLAALRLADEIPGAGSGYRLMEFTVSSSRPSSGGVLIDSHGNALGLIVGELTGEQNSNFAVPIDSVLGLGNSPITKVFGAGSAPRYPSIPAAAPPASSPFARQTDSVAVPNAPEKSEALSNSRDRDFILRNFKTMYVNANRARYFGSDQLKAELGRNKEFAKLHIEIVDDPRIADTVLEVGYTFAWDYPFELKHQNTTIVLLAGKGLGPFSGIVGAANVADELARMAKPYRSASGKK